MRRILKRFTGLFCVLALCLSLLPVSALATELPVDQTAEETETTTQPPEDADTPEPEEEVSTSAEGTVAQIGGYVLCHTGRGGERSGGRCNHRTSGRCHQ